MVMVLWLMEVLGITGVQGPQVVQDVLLLAVVRKGIENNDGSDHSIRSMSTGNGTLRVQIPNDHILTQKPLL